MSDTTDLTVLLSEMSAANAFILCKMLERLTLKEVSLDTQPRLPTGDPPATLREVYWHYGKPQTGPDVVILPDGWIRAGTALEVHALRTEEAQSVLSQVVSVVEGPLSQIDPGNWKVQLVAPLPSCDVWVGIRIASDDRQWDITLFLEPESDGIPGLFKTVYDRFGPKQLEAPWQIFRNMVRSGPSPETFWRLVVEDTELTMWWYGEFVDADAVIKPGVNRNITIQDLRKVIVKYIPGGDAPKTEVPQSIKAWVKSFVDLCYRKANDPYFAKELRETEYVWEVVETPNS